MLRLSKIVKNFDETGALNEQLSVWGFIDDHCFLTKAGDIGMVLGVEGVDYECLDSSTVDNFSKRLESAFKLFDSNFRVYQFLFKTNAPPIPHSTYTDEVVKAALEARLEYFRQKKEHLYTVTIQYVILYEGFRYRARLTDTIRKLTTAPAAAWQELKGFISGRQQAVLVVSEIEKA